MLSCVLGCLILLPAQLPFLKPGSIAIVGYDPKAKGRLTSSDGKPVGAFAFLVVDPLPKGAQIQFTQKKFIIPTPKPDDGLTSGNGESPPEIRGYFQKTTRGQVDCDLIFTAASLMPPGTIVQYNSFDNDAAIKHGTWTHIMGTKRCSGDSCPSTFRLRGIDEHRYHLYAFVHEAMSYKGSGSETKFLYAVGFEKDYPPDQLSLGSTAVVIERNREDLKQSSATFCPYLRCTFGKCNCGSFKFVADRAKVLRTVSNPEDWYVGTDYQKFPDLSSGWLRKYRVVCSNCGRKVKWVCRETSCRFDGTKIRVLGTVKSKEKYHCKGHHNKATGKFQCICTCGADSKCTVELMHHDGTSGRMHYHKSDHCHGEL